MCSSHSHPYRCWQLYSYRSASKAPAFFRCWFRVYTRACLLLYDRTTGRILLDNVPVLVPRSCSLCCACTRTPIMFPVGVGIAYYVYDMHGLRQGYYTNCCTTSTRSHHVLCTTRYVWHGGDSGSTVRPNVGVRLCSSSSSCEGLTHHLLCSIKYYYCCFCPDECYHLRPGELAGCLGQPPRGFRREGCE